MAKTMLGFAAPAELLRAAPPSQAQPAAKPNAKTILGVAMPGIAPSQAAPVPPARVGSGTMLGVAMPGIAPLQPHAAPVPAPVYEPPPPIVPAPAPLQREAPPAAPVRAVRKGLPIAVVAVVIGVMVLGAGVVLLFVSRAAPPIGATAKVSTDGKEQLHLRCETCADGTVVTTQGAKATFAAKEADLDLPAPLTIGDNRFRLAIDRPGVGRDETVELVLPLAYRIRGDLDGVTDTPPSLRIEVEAQKGVVVTIDGKPVALDASGKATVAYDISADTTGPADDARTLERKVPYEATDKDGKKFSGEVLLRTAIVPLHIDAPSGRLITQDGSLWVAGRTAKGADVTVNGSPVGVAPDGTFEGKIDLTPGSQTVTLHAAAAKNTPAKVASRTVTATVERVASLDAAGSGDPALSGSIVDVRVVHHHTSLLVDAGAGCATPPCLTRVDYGADTTLRAGDKVAAYGSPDKAVTTPDGKTVPHLDAFLVVKKKR